MRLTARSSNRGFSRDVRRRPRIAEAGTFRVWRRPARPAIPTRPLAGRRLEPQPRHPRGTREMGLAFLDDDDVWAPCHLQCLFRPLEEDGAGWGLQRVRDDERGSGAADR